MTDSETFVSSFGSAQDLPQVRELSKTIQTLSAFQFMLSKEDRSELRSNKTQLKRLVGTVDHFYTVLGPRNWVFHSDMSLPRIELVLEAKTPEQAEGLLIAYYQDRKAMTFLFSRLSRIEAFRPRFPTISRAYDDFLEGRYYACVFALIAVLDGTVNDFQKSKRKGLHSREPEEMVAWDSVTAHHLGLKHTQKTFTKTFRKTETAEVFELYRHGIVHGMVINFNNSVVAAKALNQIFAIADWADAVLQSQKEVEPQPTITGLIETVQTHRQAEQALEAFQPYELEHTNSEFENNEVVQIARSLLDAWQKQNYGKLATHFPSVPSETPGQRAGQANDLYREFKLSNAKILNIVQHGVIRASVEIYADVNDKKRSFTIHFVQVDDDGQISMPGNSGRWRLMPHGPKAFLR